MKILAQTVILALYLTETAGQQNQSAEARLLNTLLGGKRQLVRPVHNVIDSTLVKVEMVYTNLVALNSKHQILTSQVWMRLFWETPFLVWDPREYGGLDMVSLKSSQMWIPDITLYNAIDDQQEKSLFNALDSNIEIRSDGRVKWLAPAILNTDCKIAIDYFPFDSQTCPIKIASWSHDTRYIDLHFKNENSTEALTGSYQKNSEWMLMSIKKERKLVQYSCCPAPFSTLTYTIKVRRRASYYVVNIILPCGIIAALTLASFCLPPDSGERISFVITILLAMSFYMTIIADKMPPNSEVIPMISVFFMTVMVQIALVLIVTCLIIHCHFNNSSLPTYVVSLNDKLAKLVGLKKQGGNTKFAPKQPKNNAQIHGEDNLGLEVIQDLQENTKTHNAAVTELNGNAAPKEAKKSLDSSNKKDVIDADEWRFVARVLNRAFFIIFCCSSLISSLIIFFRVPRLSQNLLGD